MADTFATVQNGGTVTIDSGNSAFRATVARHRLGVFFVLAISISWAWWLPMVARGDIVAPGIGRPTELPGLAGPAIAAVVVTALADGRAGLADLARRAGRVGVGLKWWSLVLGVLVLGAAALLWTIVGGGSIAPRSLYAYTGIGTSIGPVAVGAVALLVNGFGEEIGWRGFAADHLLRRRGVTGTALIVAVPWAIWHLPLFAVLSSFRGLGWAAAGWVIGLVAGSIVLTWIYSGSGRSIALVAVWHTAFNFTSATIATNGISAAITSTAVMVLAGVIIFRNTGRRAAPARAGSVRL